MSRKELHVIPDPQDGWIVEKPHAERASAHCNTKAKAIDRARDICRNQGAECVVHGRDGKTESSNSYGNDTCPPKDKK
jgi:hypothetical protein